MLTLPIEVLNELQATAAFIVLLVDMDLQPEGSLVHYTSLDDDVWYEGIKYEPIPLSISDLNISAGQSVDDVTLSIDNVSLLPAALFLNNDLRGKPVDIWICPLDGLGKPLGRVNLFSGFISRVEIRDKVARITVASEMVRWREPVLRRHSSTCPWRFKDSHTCKYAGTETWCDKTWERCVALGNTIHFGGFRYLPSIQEKQIWWGRVPK